MKRSFITGAALAVVMVAMLALAACSSGAPASMASAAASSASSTSSSQASSSTSVASNAEADVITIALDYNAGTGYEWRCAIDPSGVIEQLDQQSEDQATSKDIVGGSLRDVFTLKALAPGETVATFDLVRSWEGEPVETYVYAFTVTDDLKMILNPYKSDFENEPEWAN